MAQAINETPRAATLSAGQKFVLAAFLAALAAMFIGSFVYRMQGAGLVVEVKQERGGMGGGMAGVMGGVDMEHLRGLMRQMEQNPNDPAVLLELGNTFMMMQAWDKALEFLEQADRLTPADPRVLRALGMTRFERGDHEAARKAFEQVLKKEPDDALAHYNMGILLKHYLKRTKEAEAHFRRVVQLKPSDPEVLKSAEEELVPGAAK